MFELDKEAQETWITLNALFATAFEKSKNLQERKHILHK